MEEARAEVEAQAPEKRREDLNGRGGTSVRSPSAHEGATALSMVDSFAELTITVRRVSIRELPYFAARRNLSYICAR